jgi:recombination protein RecA
MMSPRVGEEGERNVAVAVKERENNPVKGEVKSEAMKARALEAAMERITKDFGKGAIMSLGDRGTTLDVEAVSTGILGIDLALGVGGLPRGRIIEVFGPESGGKTTLCLHAVAAVQKNGGAAAFIDAEHALDPVYAAKLGVKIDSLLVSQPGSGEEALEITDALVRSGAIDIIVIDSVAALVPRAEIEGDMGDSHMGLQARLMSQALRKLTASVSRSKTICVFINQLREKIGVVFGNPETTPGGRALKFYSSVRIDVRGSEPIKRDTTLIGKRVKVKIVKNKVAPPFKETVLDMIYGSGISNVGSLIDMGLEHQILESKGAWIRWQEEGIGQGREKAKEWLVANDTRRVELEGLIKSAAIERLAA